MLFILMVLKHLRRRRFDKDLFPEKELVKLKNLRTFLNEKCSKIDWLGIYALKEE
jgi:putative methionine-R-sulfoxide reductase with GAF domain